MPMNGSEIVVSRLLESSILAFSAAVDEALLGHLVGQIGARIDLNLGVDPIGHGFVPIVAAELRIARSGEDLEGAVSDIEDRDIQSAAARSKTRTFSDFFDIQSISQARKRSAR